MSHAANYLAWQHRLISPFLGQRVLEVGCGIGNFTGSLLDRELVLACDIEPACVARLEQRYAGRPNLRAFVCEPGSADFAGLARGRPDSCLCINVLEHIADDARALAAMAAVLATGASIVLLVPAFPALSGPIDRNLGHYRRYTRQSLERLARVTGLAVRTLHYMNAIGFFGWWMNARILRRQAQSRAQIELFDRAVVPWLARLEGLSPPPFGQSLFAVLRKP
jgi:SAM-dependent methyltransferase